MSRLAHRLTTSPAWWSSLRASALRYVTWLRPVDSVIRQLAERHAKPLPELTSDVAALAVRVEGHLKRMGLQF